MRRAQVAERGEPYAWVLHAMGEAQVAPDQFTVTSLLKLQRTLRTAKGVWRWGRKSGAAHGRQAWHHFIESHVRLGRPERAALLIELMERRDGTLADTYSHNLYMRALIASKRPRAAVAHFERMCTESAGEEDSKVGREGDREAVLAGSDAPAGHEVGDEAGDGGGGNVGGTPKTPNSPQSSKSSQSSQPSKSSHSWLQKAAPTPDRHSFSIALTAVRRVEEEEARAAETRPLLSFGRRVGAKQAGAATRLLRDAEARGLLPRDTTPPPAVAHSLISACGADVRLAIQIWKEQLRPRIMRAREMGEARPAYARRGEQPTSEQAAYHALLRVCGVAGRPDEALKVCPQTPMHACLPACTVACPLPSAACAY